jgi:hypothetical protein
MAVEKLFPRNSQKQKITLGAQQTTFSILVDIFYPCAGTVFSKEAVFNSHACLQQLISVCRRSLLRKTVERSDSEVKSCRLDFDQSLVRSIDVRDRDQHERDQESQHEHLR